MHRNIPEKEQWKGGMTTDDHLDWLHNSAKPGICEFVSCSEFFFFFLFSFLISGLLLASSVVVTL